ncbi:uncharacterized protein RCC_00053 [Ramularia collo-cygni]|uniref:Secreted protein n=1 Tax=Ramularia collo-cygni TaxID=112498 RepID=A0A2D3UMM0_9PEZI|nr:uncharacterized protein RCC_00053 [Ramularia collo-cygni]CZT14078.1 uncharacterized protein RCC_00053 [Ramularia collo-cygni]
MRTTAITMVLAGALGAINAAPIEALIARDLIGALPASADSDEQRFQPLTDFDTDGCYYTSAIDSSGRTNPGLPVQSGTPVAGECREASRLQNNNVYSRKRCNNGWCAIMYEYYFERDVTGFEFAGSVTSGHRHDWENIVIFTQNNVVKRIAPSCHGKYEQAMNTPGPLVGGDRAKLVFNKDGPATHCWRFANGDDDARQENYTGRWFLGNLVGYNNWPSLDLRQKLFDAFHGGIAPKLWDFNDAFTNNLRSASNGQTGGFDPSRDG